MAIKTFIKSRSLLRQLTKNASDVGGMTTSVKKSSLGRVRTGIYEWFILRLRERCNVGRARASNAETETIKGPEEFGFVKLAVRVPEPVIVTIDEARVGAAIASPPVVLQ